MSESGKEPSGQPFNPLEINSEDWKIAESKVTLEEDGIRVTIELAPRSGDGPGGGTIEVYFRPF